MIERMMSICLTWVSFSKSSTEKTMTSSWTKQLGTTESDFGLDVTTDSSGNIYVTGETKGGLDGNLNSGKSDIFLVKFNSSGIKQ